MELEQRVKALEYEVKILKNEIQRSFKDVQDHVIAQYKAGKVPAATAAQPAIKQVSLDEIRQTQKELVSEAEQEFNAKLNAWASGNVTRIGKARVSRLVDVFADHGFIKAAEQKTILDALTQISDAGPAKAPLTQILDAVFKLDELLDRKPDGEEALTLIEEANIG